MEKKFIKALDEDYKEDLQREYPPKNKLQYLGESVFDFTTYDGDMDELFASIMIEVIDCILQRKTFEYISDAAKNIQYLLMVNMPFMVDKLDWGGSIRGAWFDDNHTCEIFYGLSIESGELTEFMTQLIEWVGIIENSPALLPPTPTEAKG